MQSDTYDCLGLTEKPKLTHERPPVDVKEEHAVFKPRFSNLHLRPRGPSGDGGRRHVRNCKYPTPDQVAVAQRPHKLMARERRTMLCSPRSGEVSQLNHDLFPDAIRSGGRRLHGSDTAVTHVVSGIHSPRPFSRTRRARSRSIESEQVDSLLSADVRGRACPSRIRCQAATGSWTKSRQWEIQRTLFSSVRATVWPPAKVNGVWPFNDAWLRTSLSEAWKSSSRATAACHESRWPRHSRWIDYGWRRPRSSRKRLATGPAVCLPSGIVNRWRSSSIAACLITTSSMAAAGTSGTWCESSRRSSSG